MEAPLVVCVLQGRGREGGVGVRVAWVLFLHGTSEGVPRECECHLSIGCCVVVVVFFSKGDCH